MLYRVHIDRSVTNYDRFTRLIEADKAEDANEIATRIAQASNAAVPDDMIAAAFDDEFGDWYVSSVEPTDARDADLYVTVDLEDQSSSSECMSATRSTSSV